MTLNVWYVPRSVLLLTLTVSPSIAQGEKKPAEPWQVRGIQSALSDPLPSVQLLALQAMASFSKLDGISPEQLTPFLAAQDNPPLVTAAAFGLGQMQAKEQAPELVRLLKDPDSDVRAAAASTLGQVQAKERAPELVKLLKHPDADVRQAAASALGELQAKEQAPELVRLLKDPDADVRRAAASALGEPQAKGQAPELVKLLKHPDTDVRRAAASALGQMQAKEQAPELVKLLKDPYPGVRQAAASALGQMGPFPKGIIPELASAYYFDHSQQGEDRFLCYYLTGGDRMVALALRRVMFEADQKPIKLTGAEQSRQEIAAFLDLIISHDRWRLLRRTRIARFCKSSGSGREFELKKMMLRCTS